MRILKNLVLGTFVRLKDPMLPKTPKSLLQVPAFLFTVYQVFSLCFIFVLARLDLARLDLKCFF